MAADLETLKSSLRIDGNDDDELLKGYLSAATNYIKQSIGDENGVSGFYEMDDVSDLFETAVYALAGSYWYYRTFSLYCAPYTRSIAYSYQLTAEQLEQVVVIIRHNSKVYEGIKCQYKGKLYDVINDSIDDSSNYLSCDYLTLKQVTKGA